MAIAKPFQSVWSAQGLTEQTLIQTAVYEPLKRDEWVIGLAPTGSGKTFAFGLPLLEKIVPGDGLQVIILAPSQELVVQIRDALQPYAQAIDSKILAITGAANVKRQLEKLKEKPEIVVATAGRLLGLVSDHRINLATLQTMVIDEADEMLRDPAFDQVRQITMAAPGELQMAFFSATDSPIFDELAKWFGQSAQRFDVRQQDQTQGEVAHLFLQTDRAHQIDWLRELAHIDHFQALVFFNRNTSLERAAGILRHQAVKFAVLSREGRQVQRQKALTDFRKHRLTLLLVTDMAGRGLDIPKLPAVINFEAPKRAEAYIHRAGRTGRMGQKGQVITLGDAHDRRDLQKLVPQYRITRAYLQDGKLTTDKPRYEPRPVVQPETVTSVSSVPRSASTDKFRERATVAPTEKPKKKPHKKNRLRDRKNKGRPAKKHVDH